MKMNKLITILTATTMAMGIGLTATPKLSQVNAYAAVKKTTHKYNNKITEKDKKALKEAKESVKDEPTSKAKLYYNLAYSMDNFGKKAAKYAIKHAHINYNQSA